VTTPAADEPALPELAATPEATGTPRQLALLSVGTLLIGVSGYLFLVVIGHGRFSPAVTASLSAVYLLSTILGPGIFVAVEQETSRLVSSTLAAGGRPGPVAKRAGAVAAILAGTCVALLALVAPAMLDLLLNGQLGLVLALGLTMVGSAGMFWLRGLAGGQRRFGSYAVTLLVDAGVRIVGCLALALSGSTDPFWYAMALCAAPAVAAVVTLGQPRTRQLERPVTPVPDRPVPRLGTVFGGTVTLLVASALSMAMANLAPVLVTAALPAAPDIAFAFTTAVVLTRVPLLLMGPVQAVLLPGMTAAVTTGRMDVFRSRLHRGLALLAGIGVLAVLGCLLAGRLAVRILFGPAADLTATGRLALLAAAAAVQAAILLVTPALVALGRHRAVLIGWIAGAAAFAACFLLPLDPLDRGTLAQLVGPVVTLAVQLLLVRTSDQPPQPAPDPTPS
jgi:O-antigen/teichoic acid export membrane protein